MFCLSLFIYLFLRWMFYMLSFESIVISLKSYKKHQKSQSWCEVFWALKNYFFFQTFYSQVSSPLLRTITIDFLENTVNNITQNRFDKFFSGSELIVAGKLQPMDLTTLQSITTASAVSPMSHLSQFRFKNLGFMAVFSNDVILL